MTPSPLTRRVLSDQLRYGRRHICQADLDALDVEVGKTRIEPEGPSLIEIGIAGVMAGFVIFMTWNGSLFG